MSTPAPAERLQPSLLDRLIDDDPTRTQEAREARVLTKPALRAAVLRDLAWLFNAANQATVLAAGRYPQVESSVLNYGLPSLSGGYASSIDIGHLEASIRHAILTFEPRIVPQSLQVRAEFNRSVLEMHNQIGLVIQGLLWAQPVPLEILLRTQIDLEEGGIRVVEEGR